MIAIRGKGQLHHFFFVPLERRHLLVRSDVPNRNAPIAGAGGEPVTVSGKRNAAIATRSRTELESILAASSDIPKANVSAAGDERWTVGQQGQSPRPPGMSRKVHGFA